MDLEGKDDDMSENSQTSNSSDAYESEENESEYHYVPYPYFKGGIVRVPLSLLNSVAATARTSASSFVTFYNSTFLSESWITAVALNFPDTPLGKLGATDPSPLPRWLLERTPLEKISLLQARLEPDLWLENMIMLGKGSVGFCLGTIDYLTVLRPGGIFVRGDSATFSWYKNHPGHNSESLLAAALQCRFREGFASEGMLCNEPPIPLRVLDFLEHAEDLLNLALVCKATHQAGHVLLQREFLDLHSNGIGSIGCAILRRKRSMVESAMRHPIPKTTASTSTLALKTGIETCSGADAEEPDHLCEFMADWTKHDCLEQLMFNLVRASNSPESDPSRPPPLVNQVDPVLPCGWMDWREHLVSTKRFPVVMDGEAVKRAAAMLEDFFVGTSSSSDATDCAYRQIGDRPHHHAREVAAVVHAAKREGQGLILHGQFYDESNIRYAYE